MCNVDLATGRLDEIEFDFEVPGPIPLRMVRTYRSNNRIPGDLGPGWGHDFDVRLWSNDRNQIIFRGADGRRIEFDREALTSTDGQLAIRVCANRCEKATLAYISTAPLHEASNDQGNPLARRRQDYLRSEFPEGTFAVSLAAAKRSPLTYLFDARRARNAEQAGCPWRGIIDANDNLVRLSLDENGYLRQADTDWQRQLLFRRNRSGRLEAISLQQSDKPESRIQLIQFQYDREGRLVAARDAAGTRRYEYFEYKLIRHWDREGAVCETSYDRQGRVTESIRMGGVQRRCYHYDDQQQTTQVTDSLGHTSTAKFNEQKQVTQTVDEAGKTSTFQYDGAGRMARMTDQSGGTSQMLYGPNGRPLGKVDRRGEATMVELDEQGNVRRKISPAGVVAESYERDPQGRVVQTKRAGRGNCQLKRADNGEIEEVTTPHGKNVQLNWSPDRLRLEEIDEQGQLTIQTFDILGRLLTHVDPCGGTTRYTYAENGYLATVSHPDGAVERYDCDAEGRVVTYQSVAGDTSRFQYDAAGQRMQVQVADQQRLTMEYDNEKRLTAVREQNQPAFAFDYDATGKMVRQRFPDGRVEHYRYDDRGFLAVFQDAAGQETEIKRDSAGQVAEICYGDGSLKRTERNEDGKWIRTQWRDHETSRDLDSEGRTIVEHQDGFAIWKEYSDAGDLQSITDGDARRIEYTYDEAGRIEQVKVAQGRWRDGFWQPAGRNSESARNHQFKYDRCGRCTLWQLPSAKTEKREYDLRGRLTRQQILKQDRLVVSRQYTYDRAGRVIELNDSRRGLTRYQYDDVGRLTGVADASQSISYRYDAKGDRYTSQQDRYAAGHRLIQNAACQLAYDDAGQVHRRQSTHGTDEFHYCGLGYLSRCQRADGVQIQYEYDGLYRLVAVRREQASTTFRWSDPTTLWCIDHTDRKSLQFTSMPGAVAPLEQVVGGKVYSIHTDHIGRVMELVDEDGNVAWENPDDVWGDGRESAPKQAVACPLGMPGQVWEAGARLFYNRYRFYDPTATQYLTPDPIGIWGGLNSYSYVVDPVNTSDPMGLKCRGKTDDPTLFRGDSRGPDEICSEGFQPRNPNAGLSLFQHVEGVPPTGSNWISTTYKAEVGDDFGDDDGYVYVIDNPGCGEEVDCDPEVMQKYGDPDESEHEIAFNKPIPPKNVLGFWKKSDGPSTFQACP